MATVMGPERADNREESRRQVAHPLQRLRGYIRLYVAGEGLAILAMYVALWFWIGLVVDYGFFRAFTIDWVQELPRSVRLIVLIVLSLGLVGVVGSKVVFRLFRQFRAAPLALVLERRFPHLLGDRLITAVELADPRAAAQYGFSRAMLDETIRDAALRTEQLPISDVFDWKRLARLGRTVALLTLGVYLLVALFYIAYSWSGVNEFAGRFNDVAALWFERNILLHDTIWPRHAHLELLNSQFIYGNEMRLGRDAPPPTLRVRALKWVIADSHRKKAPEGWRSLTWIDLTEELLGAPVPTEALPKEWSGWTVDQIELALDKPEISGSLPGEALLALREFFGRLHDRATSATMSRELRELEIPQEVTIYFKGTSSSAEQTMQRQVGHEYSGQIDLKESVRFSVRGKDYYTPSKRFIVVPPPTLVELSLDEAQPAYLYHHIAADGTWADLKGKKHLFLNRPVSLTGDTTRIDVPAGTDVVLTAKTDKTLKMPGGIGLLPPRKGLPEIKAPVEQPDGTTFRTRFNNLSATVDFVFQYTDTDGVMGARHVILKPVEDAPPEVDVQVEVVRKTGQGYMVTPLAQVPLSGKIRDDRGLAGAEYAYTVVKIESPEGATRPERAAAVPALAAAGWVPSIAVIYLMQPPPLAGDDDVKKPQIMPLTTFDQPLRERARAAASLAKLEELLKEAPRETMLKEHVLDPDFEFFAVEKLGLKTTDDKAAQPRYRVRLWVNATDNNIETGPRTSPSKEKFTLVVVSENELLAEIGKEEENLHVKLEEAVNRLKDGKIKLDKVAQEIPELKPEEFSPMARRAEEVEDALTKSWDASREVLTEYKRILKELRVNRVQEGMIHKVNDKICEPLDGAINLEFVQSDESLRDLTKKLDDKVRDQKGVDTARQNLDRLINRLNAVLEAMADVTTINRIIDMLVKIEKGEKEELDRLRSLLKRKQEEILDNSSEPPQKPK